MCGIAGFYGFEDKQLLQQMLKSIAHRGPDQHGTFTDRKLGLAHSRLSILDLSEKGKQPMVSDDGTVALIFNGEIYNYKALREQLYKEGHGFESRTDTEVILRGYEQWGLQLWKSSAAILLLPYGMRSKSA